MVEPDGYYYGYLAQLLWLPQQQSYIAIKITAEYT